jgi:predicted enzyme related to lactoylglutathione lyase
MSNEIQLSNVRQIAITVSDVTTALPFYRDVLGLQFLSSPGEQFAFLAAGDIRIMLTTPQGAGVPGANSILYFAVGDISTAHAAMLARGANEERGPQIAAKLPDHEVWTAFIRDPDGNLLGLMEERAALLSVDRVGT